MKRTILIEIVIENDTDLHSREVEITAHLVPDEWPRHSFAHALCVALREPLCLLVLTLGGRLRNEMRAAERGRDN